MKLGAAYCFFNGGELLRDSIKSIRNNVDYVVVNAQKVSYYGVSWNEKNEDLLSDLCKDKLIDKLVFFTNKYTVPKQNELAKRNQSFDLLKEHRCSHFMLIDSDEFYTDRDLKKAKKITEKLDKSITLCECYAYFKKPIYRTILPESTLVPVIQKILPNTEIVLNMRNVYGYKIDCTRLCNNVPPHIYLKTEACVMHHMKDVRINNDSLKDKYRNHASVLIEFATEEQIRKVDNVFDNWKIEDHLNTHMIVSNVFDINF